MSHLIYTFEATPPLITVGESSVLSWTTNTLSASASIDQGVGAVPLNGSFTVSPLRSTNYRLTVSPQGSGGDNFRNVTVSVSNLILVDLPTGIPITSLELSWENPGQITHRSPYTGDEIIINRGVGRLLGSVEIGATDDELLARRIEYWLGTLISQNAICELPLYRPHSLGYLNVLFSTNYIGGQLVMTLQFDISANTLTKGSYIRVGNRTLLITDILSLDRIVCVPQVVMEPGAQITSPGTVRARRLISRSDNPSPRTPDWYGPWSFEWVESL